MKELIERARHAVGSGVVRDGFEAHLSEAGWCEDYEDSCRTHWTRRAPSLAFSVKESFPRLTADMLRAAGASMDRVPEVMYKLDLSEVIADAPSLGYLQAALSYGGRT